MLGYNATITKTLEKGKLFGNGWKVLSARFEINFVLRDRIVEIIKPILTGKQGIVWQTGAMFLRDFPTAFFPGKNIAAEVVLPFIPAKPDFNIYDFIDENVT